MSVVVTTEPDLPGRYYINGPGGYLGLDRDEATALLDQLAEALDMEPVEVMEEP